jgi:hypothetical protein
LGRVPNNLQDVLPAVQLADRLAEGTGLSDLSNLIIEYGNRDRS